MDLDIDPDKFDQLVQEDEAAWAKMMDTPFMKAVIQPRYLEEE